jgi:hypothetical protein
MWWFPRLYPDKVPVLPCPNPFFPGGHGGKFLSLPLRGRRPLTVLRFPIRMTRGVALTLTFQRIYTI